MVDIRLEGCTPPVGARIGLHALSSALIMMANLRLKTRSERILSGQLIPVKVLLVRRFVCAPDPVNSPLDFLTLLSLLRES